MRVERKNLPAPGQRQFTELPASDYLGMFKHSFRQITASSFLFLLFTFLPEIFAVLVEFLGFLKP